MAKDKIILALDVDDPAYALELVDRFKDQVDTFKVGLELFCLGGPKIVDDIHKRGKRIFLDLKFHDIPNTMTKAALAAARMGVFMFNVHASAGREAMRATRDKLVEVCLKENLERPKMIAVTVLTSLDTQDLHDQFGIQHTVRTHVKHLSVMAKQARLDGVVASAQEVDIIKHQCGAEFITVTPGIRPSWVPPGDQQRTMTPREAVRHGADYIVLGRSVLSQPDPERALELIVLEMMTLD